MGSECTRRAGIERHGGSLSTSPEAGSGRPVHHSAMFGRRFSPDRWMSPPPRPKRPRGDPAGIALRDWRYGVHPHAEGMQIRSIGRVELRLGEALRIEMTDPSAAEGGDTAHLQYYIVTDAGPWALWLSCDRSDLEARETALHDLPPPSDGED